MLATSIPVTAAATAALSVVALAALRLVEQRTGRQEAARLNTRHAALAMGSADFLRVSGAPRSWAEITGFYPVRDGWVYLHGNFPHLRDGLLELFDMPNDRAAVARRMFDFTRDEVEEQAAGRGLCAAANRTRAEWDAHPQSAAVRSLPLIELRRIGDAPPRQRPPATAPLGGCRVLDLTRVIAGPMCGRTLAEHGADVLLVSGPHLPFLKDLVIDTGFAKRAAFVDLRRPEGHAQLAALAREADVFVDAYRPGSLGRRGFSPAALAHMSPGIVAVTISAYSRAGPWRNRRGYDSLVQGPLGLALADTDTPRRLPFQPLDYLTGYLAAFGAMLAIERQAREGGSWHVELSLARTAQWLWELTDLLGRVPAPPAANPTRDDALDLIEHCDSDFGRLSYLRPAVTIAGRCTQWSRPPVLLGTDRAEWL